MQSLNKIDIEKYLIYLLNILALIFIYFTSRYNYLLFHTIIEFYCIAFSFGIFILAWNLRQFLGNNYLIFIGIASLFTGIFYALHALSYRGIGIFGGIAENFETQLWITARYLSGISFIVAFFFLKRKVNHFLVFLGYFILTSILLLTLFYFKIFPDCYVAGIGFTKFKIFSEYIIYLILITSIILLFAGKNKIDKTTFILLMSSMLAAVLSELIFTSNADLNGLFSIIGHYIKIVFFYLIYLAVVKNGFAKQFNFKFTNPEKAKQAVRKKELIYSEKEFLKAKRLSDISALVSSIAHELKNNLGVMQLAAYNIRKKNQNNLLDRHIENIEKKIMESTKIFDNLSIYSNIKLPFFDNVNLYNVLSESINSAEESARIKDVKINKNLNLIKNINIRGDVAQLKEIFYNILNNSFQSLPDKNGKIDISVDLNDEEYLTIVIKDNGAWIEENDPDKIFNPFFNCKSKKRDLGLTVCRELVDLHDGKITVSSKAGIGTTVIINLPKKEF